jgi:sugar (pentulose or hexulose) kinase
VQNAGIALRQALAWLDATAEQANAALDQGVQASDPLFVPYIAGERTPFVDPRLRGAWLGLGLDTSREAMLRSVVEGVAHAVALGIDAVLGAGARLPDPLPLIGGGSVDARFRQLIADASGRRLAPRDQPDAAVVGAAFLALGVSASPVSGADDLIEPLSSAHELLAARRQRLVEYVQHGHQQ